VIAFPNKLVFGTLVACFMVGSQAQGAGTRWLLRVENMNHEMKIDARIRLTQDTANESCMGGHWKRVVVEEKSAYDERFFPLVEPLAYRLEDKHLTLGRTAICDGYLFLSGKAGSPQVNGTYDAVDMSGGQHLGYFTLTRLE
jgi:hypothetical protein